MGIDIGPTMSHDVTHMIVCDRPVHWYVTGIVMRHGIVYLTCS